jgi:ubiquinone/menaquinone biosynthesis C-methylase UbiE
MILPTGIVSFVHPVTKVALKKTPKGDIFTVTSPDQVLFKQFDGSYDFALSVSDRQTEREFYDQQYEHGPASATLTADNLAAIWNDLPENQTMLSMLGDLRDKTVLLLGNGVSQKEFFFLAKGALCIYSDLSVGSIRQAKEIFVDSELWGPHHTQIEFHAVDALNLPFPGNTFDVIYGWAFAHHIQNLDTFLTEVQRCLKPGGICRFLDDGYSSLWQFSKTVLLRPLQMYSHRRTGISPEDLEATKKGGYRREEIETLMHRHGFAEMVYIRRSFWQHLLHRGSTKLNLPFQRYANILLWVDQFLENRTQFMKKQGLRLIWGFTK